LSARTNLKGLQTLQSAFPGTQFITVDIAEITDKAKKLAAASGSAEAVPEVLHLKSFCSMCSEDMILTGGALGLALQNALRKELDQPQFLNVPDVGASNCVYVNQTLIRRSRTEFPNSEALFREHIPKYIRHVEVEAGELAKVDGALTCCSLLLR
jgi:N-dimethylarginine dimethylaminohydrolase